MKKANKALAALLAASMVAGSLAGCGSSTATDATGSTESAAANESTTGAGDSTATGSSDTLVAASNHFDGKFSPFFAQSADDNDIISMTQLMLAGTDRQGAIIMNGIEGETRPYNGTDYTYYSPSNIVMTENEDGTVYYDVTIRDDLKFSDGTPVDIDDAIFSLYVYADPPYDGSTTIYSQQIVGME